MEYDTKVMRPTTSEARQAIEAPVVRSFPAGWEYFIKRGEHCVRNPEGLLKKFTSKQAALDWANV